MESFIPLSEYASKLEEHVKQRYLQQIPSIGVDPALIEGKLTLRTRQPDCLSPVESIDLLFYLVLETSFYSQQQFKVFRSLQAYNQMVSGFIASVQGHILAYMFVVLDKLRHYSIVYSSLTFRALALRQGEIRHRISGESRISIAIIHAVNIRETVDNEMEKRYAKS